MTVRVDVPVAPARLLNVDALRGFALFGILAVNVWAFADPYYASPESNPTFDSGLDHAIRFAISLLFETKFYLLFSFLFGYSFTLQMAAAERAGTAFMPRMLRRQTGLLAIGLVHGAALYYGEILSTYAILGLILLACRRIAPRRAVQLGIGLVITVGVVWMLLGLATLAEGGAAATAASDAAVKLTAFGGDAAATLGFHSGHLPETVAAIVALQAPSAMAMFFFGFAAGRVQVFANPDRFRPLMRRILIFGFPVGLLGALVYALAAAYAPGGGVETFAFGLGQLTAPLLTASYVVAGLMLFRTDPGRRVEAALAPMGKTALTNYLFQSLVLGVLFTGYGFGLVDRLSPPAVAAVVPLIFATQLVLSRWWLRGHRYGPAEWALRAITIAGIPPWRRHGD
ncbi:DUF418 domain-containing protein [Rhodococcus daqingensis]|uniref:DUF418 domain-containing protein n=1 Tax=Rhodococcus daqingensis TaxID=2479363 RepID=A0ABW2RXF7_9NOCA